MIFNKPIYRGKNLFIWEIALAVFFSLVINIPDLYPLLMNPHNWVPINAIPYAIGDEYHYYSNLTSMTMDDIFGVPTFKLGSVSVLTMELVKILAYYINLPFFFIGTHLADVRFGVLFVRIFDGLLLYFALYVFFSQLLSLLSVKNSKKLYTHLLVIIAIIFYTPLHASFAGSVSPIASVRYFWESIDYMFNNRLIYDNSTINDLTRAIFISTSGPVLLLCIAFLLNLTSDRKHLFTKLMLLFLTLSFIHIPSAAVFLLVTAAVFLVRFGWRYYLSNWYKFLLFLCLFLLVVFFQNYVLSVQEISQELIPKGLELNFQAITFGTLYLPLLYLILYRRKVNLTFLGVYFSLALVALFAPILGYESGSRLWARGALFPYAACTVFFAFILIKDLLLKLNSVKMLKVLAAIGLISCYILLINFFSINTNFLYQTSERRTDHPQLLAYMMNRSNNDIIITNSFETALWGKIYSASPMLLQHFTLQPDGYKKNLQRVIDNFILLGVPEAEMRSVFSSGARYSDWLPHRVGITEKPAYYDKFYKQSIILLSIYHEYNRQVYYDGYFSPEKQPTAKINDLIEEDYERFSLKNYSNARAFDIIIDRNNPYANESFVRENYSFARQEELDKGRFIVFEKAKLKEWVSLTLHLEN